MQTRRQRGEAPFGYFKQFGGLKRFAGRGSCLRSQQDADRRARLEPAHSGEGADTQSCAGRADFGLDPTAIHPLGSRPEHTDTTKSPKLVLQRAISGQVYSNRLESRFIRRLPATTIRVGFPGRCRPVPFRSRKLSGSARRKWSDVLQVLLDVIHRLRAGQSMRAIARGLGHSRDTVSKYRDLAEAKGYLDADRGLPDAAASLGKWAHHRLPPSPRNGMQNTFLQHACAARRDVGDSGL